MEGLLVLALLLSGQDPPAGFELSTPRGYFIGGVDAPITVRAVDGSGRTVESYSDRAEIDGLAGGKRPLTFEKGSATLDAAFPSGTVTVRAGALESTWSPRVIPGWLSIVPPLLAIALAIAFRQVLIALLAGIWVGVWIVVENPFTAILRTFDAHLVTAVTDNIHILIFTMALGGMVGIISRSGGAKALVLAASRYARSRRSGMLSTWGMGLLVFFDDYANCLLVGNTVRPFTDSQRISREKLSFIVDATAAPVAAVGFITTWVGYEIGLIADLEEVPKTEAYGVFLATLPYSFYNLFMLFFVFMIAWTGRDFGPMLRAEHRALTTGKLLRDGAVPLMDRELTEMKVPDEKRLTVWNAVVPIGSIALIVVVGLIFSGLDAIGGEWTNLRDVIGNADSLSVLLWASFGGSIIAIGLAAATRALSVKESLDAWVTGCKAMVMACLILALAWTLGGVCKQHLMTGPWVISLLDPGPSFVRFLPLIVFLVSCLIAFSTGTSFGTMAIVFPIAGPMVWALTGDEAGLGSAAESIRYATLGSVLAGAVFGDHCSPISDTTVMSSMAAASDHVDHVKTQAPYALVCAAIAAVVGCIPAGFGVWPGVSWIVGGALIVGVVLFLGRAPQTTSSP